MFKLYTATVILFTLLHLSGCDTEHRSDEHQHAHESTEPTEHANDIKVPADDQRITHAQHQHGHARLTIAQENTSLKIELMSPASNLFGFEHLPSNDKQRDAIRKAVSHLKQGSALFPALNAFECEQSSLGIESAIIDALATQGKHTSQKSADEPHTADEGMHNDVHVHWQFSCAKTNKLDAISTHLFSHFPGLDELQVEWVNSHGAGMTKLSEDGSIALRH